MKNIIAILMILFLSGCGVLTDVENKAYLVALGVEKCENGIYGFTFMFSDKEETDKEDSDKEEKEDKSECSYIEAENLFTAIKYLSGFKSKRIDLSHTKLILFSEEIAKEGIDDFLITFGQDRELRPSTYMCVSKDKPSEFLKNVKPPGEPYAEKYFELLFSRDDDRYSKETTLSSGFFAYESLHASPVMLYGAINDNEIKNEGKEDDFSSKTEAGDTPRKSKDRAEFLGLSVFKKGQMKGVLNETEETFFRILRFSYSEDYFSLYDDEKQKNTTIKLKQLSRPIIKVDTKSDIPKIYANIFLEGEYVLAGEKNEKSDNDSKFKDMFSKKAEQEIKKLVKRSQSEFDSDIFGFYKYAEKNFLNIDDWEKYDWEKKYKNASFDVNVNLSITNSNAIQEE